jgi:hypothetical protein
VIDECNRLDGRAYLREGQDIFVKNKNGNYFFISFQRFGQAFVVIQTKVSPKPEY